MARTFIRSAFRREPRADNLNREAQASQNQEQMMNEKTKTTKGRKAAAVSGVQRGSARLQRHSGKGAGYAGSGNQGRFTDNHNNFTGLSGIALDLPKLGRNPGTVPATGIFICKLEEFLRKIIPQHFHPGDSEKVMIALERWTHEFFPSSNNLSYELIINGEESAIMDCDNGGYVRSEYGENNFAGLSVQQSGVRCFLVGPALTKYEKQKKGMGRAILALLKTEVIIDIFTPDMAHDVGEFTGMFPESDKSKSEKKYQDEDKFKKQIPAWARNIIGEFGAWNGTGPKELIADMNMLHDCRVEWNRLLDSSYKFTFPDSPGFISGIVLNWINDETDYMSRLWDDLENDISNEWRTMAGHFMFEIVLDPERPTDPQAFKALFETWLKSMEVLNRILTRLTQCSVEINRKEMKQNESISQRI